MLTAIFFQNYLLEILMGLVVLFNITAFKVIWEQLKIEKNERMKNTESINMIIHRVFGFEKDPTHDGHIVETEEELKDFNDKLDDIADRQREAKEVREEDHEEVRKAINFIIGELSNNENIDFDGEKL